ncbi:hypothetical protein BA065_02320 [Nanoarchaeota archaeon NZ13-N]|uniref:Uncharacterized protein n=1 Tax=Candidatus Nanoclepta minutus TaxID=1940235 RepID=A0A397WMX7_9ARCH|nr:MAG: hypothetical protein BA065_02320 [Nanoarchaeota archaeon NZ13-N]RIB35420.1 MAG: hypothetical protein BXU00_01480 [Candidatus Nanoclepta minutus]
MEDGKDRKTKFNFTGSLSAIGLGIGLLLYALNIVDSFFIIPAIMFIGTGLGTMLDFLFKRF